MVFVHLNTDSINKNAQNNQNAQAIWQYRNLTSVNDRQDAVILDHQPSLEIGTGVLSLSVNPDEVGGRQGLFSKDASNLGTGGHLTVWIKDGQIVARLQSDEGQVELTGGAVTANMWHQISVSFGENGFHLFVDGQLVDSDASFTGGLQGNSEPIVLGASQWGSSAGTADKLTHDFTGEIANVVLVETAAAWQPSNSLEMAMLLSQLETNSAGAMQFSKLADAQMIANQPQFLLDNGSISFSFNADAIGGRQGVLSKDAHNFGDGGHLTVWLQDGEMVVRLQTTEKSFTLRGGQIGTNEWHDVMVSFGDQGFKLVVDGNVVDSDLSVTSGIGQNHEPLVVGASQWGSTAGTADKLVDGFKGQIANLTLHTAQYGEVPQSAASDQPATTPEGVVILDHKDAYALDNGAIAIDFTANSVEGRQALFSKDARSFGDGGHLTIWMIDGQVHARLQTATESFELFGGTVQAGVEHQVGVAFGENGFRLFLDGAEVASNADMTDGIADNAEPIVLGASQWAKDGDLLESLTHFFDGIIRDVQFTDEPSDLGFGGQAEQNTPPAPQTPPLAEEDQPVVVTDERQTLEAREGVISNGQTGPQEWGDGVTLTAYDVHGNLAQLGFSAKAQDRGFGVNDNDGRWGGQIDYIGGRSESLVVDFGGPVTDVILRVGLLDTKEGYSSTGTAHIETGYYTAYDGDGNLVGEGWIGPSQSVLGAGVKEAGSFGGFPIAIETSAPFEKLVIQASPLDYGTGQSFQSAVGEDNSDFNVLGVSYQRVLSQEVAEIVPDLEQLLATLDVEAVVNAILSGQSIEIVLFDALGGGSGEGGANIDLQTLTALYEDADTFAALSDYFGVQLPELLDTV